MWPIFIYLKAVDDRYQKWDRFVFFKNRTETEIGLKSCEPNRSHLWDVLKILGFIMERLLNEYIYQWSLLKLYSMKDYAVTVIDRYASLFLYPIYSVSWPLHRALTFSLFVLVISCVIWDFAHTQTSSSL
jgi:hypothetical protein